MENERLGTLCLLRLTIFRHGNVLSCHLPGDSDQTTVDAVYSFVRSLTSIMAPGVLQPLHHDMD